MTVTFVHRTTGEMWTVVSPGHDTHRALLAACRHVAPGSWRIGTISTPQTIYGDITSSRKLRARTEGGGRDNPSRLIGRDLSAHIGGVRHPEMQFAGAAGCKAWL